MALKIPGKHVTLTPMERTQKPRLSDVASKARVSSTTVSRAMSNPQLGKAKTLQRVNAAVTELGYFRDGLGRALASGRTHMVGAIVPTLSYSMLAVAIQALRTRLVEADYKILVASHEYSPITEAAAVRSLLERGVDALLLVGTDHSHDVWAMIDGAAVPVVLTWTLHDRRGSIGFDYERASRLAAEDLLSLRQKRFGMISGQLKNDDRAQARLDGVRAILAKAKLELPNSRVSERAFSLAGGRTEMTSLLALADRPMAIIGGNDLLAIGALLEHKTRGVAVSGDVYVVDIDGLELAANVLPGLTTVRLPTYQLGTMAAELTLDRLKDEVTPQRIELPIELVIRGTTAPIRSAPQRRTSRRPSVSKTLDCGSECTRHARPKSKMPRRLESRRVRHRGDSIRW
jgi:LacI family transcriptional regulator